MGGEADRVQSGQKSGCWIRGLRSGLLLSRALLDWGLGVEGLEGGVANLQDEVSEPLRGRPTAAARARRENATILHNFNQTTLPGPPSTYRNQNSLKCNYFTQILPSA